ncbi:MAG: hypothetical protein IJ855_07610 [Bacteroidales bacterium]|nr:hypothetical protein [Bacteroidales bacterium]
MKTVFKFALMGFAVSALVLSSCSKSDSVLPDDPEEEVAGKNTVNASFVFSVSTGNDDPATKMSSANVQATTRESFRGITEANLLAFKQTADGKHVPAAATADKLYNLGTILAKGAINNETAPSGGTLSKRVVELALPTGTNSLMFYGKAIKDGTDAAQGKVSFTVGADLEDVSFGLESRLVDDQSATGKTAFNQNKAVLAEILNNIISAEIDYEGTQYGGETAAARPNGSYLIKWAEFADYAEGKFSAAAESPQNPGSPLSALGEIMGDAYSVINNMKDGEIRPGSAGAILRMLQDLHAVILKVKNAVPTNLQEAVARRIGEGINDIIEKYLDPQSGWKNISQMGIQAPHTLVTDANFKEFPHSYNLPMGATQIERDVTPVGTYATVVWHYAVNLKPVGGLVIGTEDNFVYPAELCYFGNSPVRVTDKTLTVADYPDGVAQWDADASWTSNNWVKNAKVLSSTRSVAMQYNINYGTSMLKSVLSYKETSLQDNNEAIQKYYDPSSTEEDKVIDMTTAGYNFELKGILIGDQPATVGWDFIGNGQFNKVVYDTEIPSPVLPTTGTADPVYTMVWDNYAGAEANVVYVAVELVNNTEDFWGKNNLIRKGGTFYLVGKLDPATVDTQIVWPAADKYALPPYNQDGSTIQQKRVFIQDYMTTANFKIDKLSLHNAYIAVPDLRSTQISLGLSVDLGWSSGLDFDVVLGD